MQAYKLKAKISLVLKLSKHFTKSHEIFTYLVKDFIALSYLSQCIWILCLWLFQSIICGSIWSRKVIKEKCILYGNEYVEWNQ